MYKIMYILVFFILVSTEVYAENFSTILDREKYELIEKKYETYNRSLAKVIIASLSGLRVQQLS